MFYLLSFQNHKSYSFIVLGTGHPLKPGPLVMLVHGGPNARDNWGYVRTSQLLANRGYAVMQCNYRGSTGYGKNFTYIANGEWGRKMHYDVIDAANWAVEQGIAEQNRIAIYGGSYGGYAALAGESRHYSVKKGENQILPPVHVFCFSNHRIHKKPQF